MGHVTYGLAQLLYHKKSFQNLNDLDFDLSRSLKVKCSSAIILTIPGFLLIFNGNIWPNSASLRDIGFEN